MERSLHVRLYKFLLRCPFCKRGFSRKADMDNHKLCVNLTYSKDENNNTIKQEVKEEHNKVESFSCPKCGEIFSRWSVFCRHTLFHTYLIVMEDSSRQVSTRKRNKLMKNKIISLSERKVELNCSPKGEKLGKPKKEVIRKERSTRNLKMCERKRRKAGFKRKCWVCGRTFNRDSCLIIHMRVHSNHRPYKCKFCACRFKQKCHVNNHERIHTGESPWECSLCGKKFRQKGNLNFHINRHH